MSSTIEYKKITWLKNTTSEGGSQDEMLSNLNGNIPLHILQPSHDKLRLWGSTTPDKVLKLVEKNIGLYEVLHSFPMKVYFDIDKTDNINPKDYLTYKDIILNYLPDADMAISGSESSTKNSYHFTINNYFLHDELERENFKQFVKNTLYPLDNGFDWKVYTKNRNMKCVNQSKQNKPIQSIIENNNLSKHLITCFLDTSNEIKLDLPKSQLLSDTRIDVLSLPDVLIKKDISTIEMKELYEPKTILSLMPISPEFDHKYTWVVARYCYHNKINFETFWSWYKAKNDSTDSYNKWVFQWSKLSEHPDVTTRKMITLLEKYYPNLEQDIEMRDFTKLFDISNVVYTEIDSLTQEHFNFDTKALILNIGMGGGKTTQTIDYLKKNCQNTYDSSGNLILSTNSFIWMTPNIALADNTFGRMKFTSTSLYNTEKKASEKKEMINNSENLVICLNSMKYVQKDYDIVVIDEIETYMKKWCFNDTLQSEVQQKCYINFIRVLQNSKHIILLDAFITNTTIQFLKDLNISFTLIKRKNDKSYNNRDAVKYHDRDDLTKDIIKNLRLGKKLMIFYPYCRGNKNNLGMVALQNYIEENTGKKGVSHNSETDDKIKQSLKDVNLAWTNYDFVISNNVITVGVNFDVEYFNAVYIFIGDFNEARDLVQFTYRPRKLIDNIIKFTFLMSYHHKDEDVQLDKNCIILNTDYTNLRNNVLIEQTSNLRRSFYHFLDIAGYILIPDTNEIYNRDIEVSQMVKSIDLFYEYKNIDTIDPKDIGLVKDLENEYYSQNCTMKTRLTLRKLHFNDKFMDKLDVKIKEELWNNNYIKLVDDVLGVINGQSKILEKLKNDYKWELHFPDDCKKINFDEATMKAIFDSGLCSRKLTSSSNHNLILKAFINHYYNEPVIKSKSDSNRNVSYHISDKFKRVYIMIKDSLKKPDNCDEDIKTLPSPVSIVQPVNIWTSLCYCDEYGGSCMKCLKLPKK